MLSVTLPKLGGLDYDLMVLRIEIIMAGMVSVSHRTEAR